MESLHYLLMKSHAMLSRRILSEAGRLGLTPGQPKVLEFLLRHGESDQKTIAAYCEIEPATVGSILLRMEEGGLILRRQKAGIILLAPQLVVKTVLKNDRRQWR